MFTLEANLKKFEADVAKYVKATGKSVTNVVNQKAYFIAKQAMDSTSKTLRANILRDMGAQSANPIEWKGNKLSYKPIRIKVNKKGKIVKPRARGGVKFIKGNTVAIDIIQSRRAKKGEAPLSKKDAKAAARKMVASKLRSIGTVKAGWLGIMRDLFYSAKKEDGTPKYPTVKQTTGGMKRVRGYGLGKHAKDGFFPTARGTYRINIDRFSGIHPKTKKWLSIAINKERQGAEAYLMKKMLEAGKKAVAT